MLADREDVPLTASGIDGLVSRMSLLPPHPEAPSALASLAQRTARATSSPRHSSRANHRSVRSACRVDLTRSDSAELGDIDTISPETVYCSRMPR